MPPARRSAAIKHSPEAVAFGLVIAKRRQALGFSQEELCFRSGKQRTYVSDLERGLKEPCLKTIFSVATALQMTPSSLFRAIEVQLLATAKPVRKRL